MRKKDKIKLLEFEVTDLRYKLSDLRDERQNMIIYIKRIETSLKSMLNEASEANNKIEELKTANHLLEREILSKNQLLEIKENQRRKSVGKVSALTKKLNALQEEKEGQNEIIKSFVKENHKLKDLVRTNKDARAYLKGKSERE